MGDDYEGKYGQDEVDILLRELLGEGAWDDPYAEEEEED